jgi:glutathione S-transferase
MRLIGMMDSPYVRRVAISLRLMGVPFVSEQISVFRNYDDFARINPVVKAPSLVTEAGVVLMDSGLILEHAELLALPERRLTPTDLTEHARAQRLIGLALAACEKSVQIAYERTLRPPDKQHQPWIDRVRAQALEAFRALDAAIAGRDGWLIASRPLQADVTTSVAWRFARHVVADIVTPEDFPAVARFSRRAEALPEFLSTPLE